jgi:carbon monoxide dehydrogenase subunit G
MDVSGDHVFHAPREAVFDLLVDPEALKRALPGCEEFRETSPEHYRVTMAVNLVVASVTVGGDVVIRVVERPARYLVRVSGSGSAGSLAVEGKFGLEEINGGTLVRYSLEIETTGALGALGAPIIEPAAKLILSQFMGALGKQLGQPAGSPGQGG